MFHWICPECGREIAPTAKECSACDPSAAVRTEPSVVAPPAPPIAAMVLTPEIVASATLPLPRSQSQILPELLLLSAPVPPKALLAPVAMPATEDVERIPAMQPRMPNIPEPKGTGFRAPQPLSAATQPLPVAAEPIQLPSPATAIKAPQPSLASEIPHAPLRGPQPRKLAEGARNIPAIAIEPLPVNTSAQLPGLWSPPAAEPPLAAPVRNAGVALSAIRPAPGDLSLAASEPEEQITLPGPTLPFELTSLDAAGIARMIPFGAQVQAARSSGTFVSVAVASGLLALAIAGVFYAMPTMARTNSEPKPEPKPVEAAVKPAPPAPARKAPLELEVTGVRFVTDLPDRPPQIHYIVVNHTHGSVSGVVVNVTLRAAENQPPLSQFSFRSPRLGPYESKEMVSSIERLNRELQTPDWRDVQTEISLEQ